MSSAEEKWRRELGEWAIPQPILDAAPEPPWGFPLSLFAPATDHLSHDTPSHRRALEALSEGGTVLDVGVGGGAGSLPLAGRASKVVGVDESAELLDAFAHAAGALGIEHEEIEGTWPAVSAQAPDTDIVIAHHVFYNVPALAAFAHALTKHARERVVIENTTVHPLVTQRDLWREFHGLERPTGPTTADIIAVLRESGIAPETETWTREHRHRSAPSPELIAFVRRRLCVTEEADERIGQLLGDDPVISPREVATMWWPGSAPR